MSLYFSSLYPNSTRKSWSSKSADILVSTGETSNSTQFLGPRGTRPEPSGHRNQGTESFRLLSVPRSWPCATALHTQIPPGENWFPRSADTQACRRDKPQSETARPANTRDNQMAKSKHKNISNRNQDYLTLWEPSSPNTENPGYPNTPEKQDWFKITSHDDDRGI